MDPSLLITIVGTGASLIGAGVAIIQARSAYKSSQDAKKAMTTVQLAAVAERLKSVQEHIRDVAPDKVSEPKRGFKPIAKIDLIRREFDTALSVLPKTGVGGSARTLLSDAQTCLNDYGSSLPEDPKSEKWAELQRLVQDTISDLTATANNRGENL